MIEARPYLFHSQPLVNIHGENTIMNQAQVLADAQIALSALSAFAPMLGPNGIAAAAIGNAAFRAISSAATQTRDVTDEELAQAKQADQAAIADDLQAQADATTATTTVNATPVSIPPAVQGAPQAPATHSGTTAPAA